MNGLGRGRRDTGDRNLPRPAVAKDVAERAGVSIATVSRALNGSPKVREETRQAVIKAVAELNFVFNNAARALSTRRFHAVGMIVPSLGNEVFVRAVSSFQRVLRQAGYQVVLASADYDLDTELQEASFLMRRGIDGLILVGGTHRRGLYEIAEHHGVPLVQSFVLSPNHYSVGFDNRSAAMRATRYLIGMGHRRIAVVTGTRHDNDRSGPRAEGMRLALAEIGVTLPAEHDIVVSSGVVAGRDAMRQLAALPAEQRPTAILCGTDEIALGVMSEAVAHGLMVPTDLSVIGFNDSSFASVISPALTTMRVDADRIGRVAGETLLSILQGQTPVRATAIDPELLVRNTVAPLRTP